MKSRFFTTFLICLSFSAISQSLVTKWGASFGMPCGTNYICYDIVTDNSGNHIITGNITAASGIYVDLNPSPTATFPISATVYSNDFYISKYDANGTFISAFIIGSSGIDVARSLAIDQNNDIIVTGYFNGTVDFDPSSTAASTLLSNGGNDIFLAKYSTSGTLIWAKSFGSSGSDFGTKVLVDNQGNIFLTGNFSGTIDIDPSTAVNNLVSLGSTDVVLAKFDSNGNLITGKSFGNIGAESAIDIALDATKKCYITGNFAGTVDFDPSTSTSFSLTNANGAFDVYVCKFDSLLNFQWAKQLVSASTAQPNDIAIDNTGNILLAGYFNLAAIDLDLSPTSTATFAANGGGENAFIAKYDSNGNYFWGGAFGNSAANGSRAMNIWSDNAGNIISTGYFVGLVDFDLATSTTNTITNSSTTLPSLYLAKYTSTGTLISANKLTNPGVKSMQSHVDANGDLLFCGNQYGGINIDPSGTFPYTLPFPNVCGNFYNAVAIKYTSCVLPVVNSISSATSGPCAQQSVTLSVNGALNSSTNWRWSQNSCSNTNTLGTGTTVVVTPTAATTVYFVKGIGGCGAENLGCTSFTFNTLPVPAMSLSPASLTTCANANFTLNASGASNYTWSTGAQTNSIISSASVSAVYSVSSTGTNACVGTKTMAITVRPPENLTYTLSTGSSIESPICKGTPVSLLIENGTAYTWTCNCSGTPGPNGQLLLFFNNLQSTQTLTVTSTATTLCKTTLAYQLLVDECTGLFSNAPLVEQQISILPNPVLQGEATLYSLQAFSCIKIKDLSGKVIVESTVLQDQNSMPLPVTDLAGGLYFIEIYANSALLTIKKLVVE